MTKRELSPVCILAGGLGTRLGPAAGGMPKALVPVAGEPFLYHQLRLLRANGARRVVLCVGHGGERIAEAVGDGSDFGLEIELSEDGPQLAGTAGAIRRALALLGHEFLVLYGDTYLRVDYAAVQEARRRSALPAVMVVLRNDGRWDRSNVVYREGRVVRYDKRERTRDMRWIDYGVGILTPEAVALEPDTSDLADVYTRLAVEGLLGGYEAFDRFYEIGTPTALAETDAFLRMHLAASPRTARR